MVCFFFQAEDGIRDIGVTGVQTCALPILVEGIHHRGVAHERPERRACIDRHGVTAAVASARRIVVDRSGAFTRGSEERRVGKECRSRGWPYHLKKKTQY